MGLFSAKKKPSSVVTPTVTEHAPAIGKWVQNTVQVEATQRYGNSSGEPYYIDKLIPSWKWEGPDPPNGRPPHPALTSEGKQKISDFAKDPIDKKCREQIDLERQGLYHTKKRACEELYKNMDSEFQVREQQIRDEFKSKIEEAIQDAQTKAEAEAEAAAAENPPTSSSSVTGGRRTKKRKQVKRRKTTKHVQK